MPLCRITRIPDALLKAELTPANDNYKSTILGMELSEERNLLNESHYNPKIEGLPVWQMAIIFLCIIALAFFLFRVEI